MRRTYTLCATAVAVLALASEARAQEPRSAAVEGELRAMVAQPSAADADRATVRDFLGRDDVRATAERSGLDLERLRRGVETLDAGAAADLADRTRAVEDDLDQVGGDTLVISSTAIIIALLVIILVVVA